MRTAYVVGLAFDGPRDRVLMIRKKRPWFLAGLLNGVGGHIEPGEHPVEAVVREFWEETGLKTVFPDWAPVARVLTPLSDVWFFAAHGVPIDDARQTTDERLFVVPAGHLHAWTLSPKLAWLVPLARRSEALAEPPTIELTEE